MSDVRSPITVCRPRACGCPLLVLATIFLRSEFSRFDFRLYFSGVFCTSVRVFHLFVSCLLFALLPFSSSPPLFLPPLLFLLVLLPPALHDIEKILTFTLTAVILVLAYLLTSKLDPVGVLPVALVITALDAALPTLVRAISSLERHHSVVTHDLSLSLIHI